MAFSDNVRSKMERKKKDITSEEILRENFNEGSLRLINRFMKDIDSGAVRLESISDFSRLFQIYAEVNNISDLGGEGSGTLPALPSQEREVIADALPIHTESDGENGTVEFVDLEALTDMTEEDIQKLLVQKEIDLNKRNEETF